MKKNYTLFFLSILLLIISCGKDDDNNITPLNIETTPDSAVITQNSETEIFIFSNDSNIPSNGQLTISNPTLGNALINTNNTPNDTSDDSVVYSANSNEVGLDSFQYTICNSTGDCKTEVINITINSNSNVVFNLDDMPYQTLSEYQFFEGDLKDLRPGFGVIPYKLNSPLFTDYAKKKRFLWMPNNTKASYINDASPLDLPVGSILIKNFYYDNVLPNDDTQIIETRLMIRKNEGWIFADYVWNIEQTEASLDTNGSFVNLQWQEDGEIKSVEYRIPANAECHTCHKVTEVAQPTGIKPRNLNLIYDYDDGSTNQLQKLVDLGYLENSLPSNIDVIPNYNDSSTDLELRVRAYLDINCAHCHSDETHCAYRPIRLDYDSTENYTNMGVCVDPDTDLGEGLGHIIEPGDPRNSVLHFRLGSIDASNRMPLLGRSIVHAEGLQLVEDWINTLTNDCN